MNENNTKKNRPKSQIMMPNSTSPLPPHSRKNGSSDSLPNHRYENEWEVRSKELAEAKTRVAQMEKTMRWWSDCTDNWRKKWSEVKTERNELRKELRLTKNQMEKLMKQLTPRQHQESLIATESVRESTKNNGFVIYSNTPTAIAIMSSVPCSSKNPYHQKPISLYENNKSATSQYANFPLSRKNAQTQTTALSKSQLSVIDKEIVSLLEEKVVQLTSKLDEVNRRLSIERDEKAHLHLTIDRLRRDLSDLQELYESLKKELCEINGKEFTESEVDSYAEEETEEVRLIDQLTRHDGEGDEEELEEDDFDPENEADIDKHTPTAEIPKSEVNIEEIAQGIHCTSLEAKGVLGKVENIKSEAHETNPSDDDQIQIDSSCKDLASSIQVEILEVHKKLDLKTFISDVTDLVAGVGIVGNASEIEEEAESQNEESAIQGQTKTASTNKNTTSNSPILLSVVNGTTGKRK